MGLKRYRIDTSPLDDEAQKQAMTFIETNAFTSDYIPKSSGAYICYWEENTIPSDLPALSGCIVQELP